MVLHKSIDHRKFDKINRIFDEVQTSTSTRIEITTAIQYYFRTSKQVNKVLLPTMSAIKLTPFQINHSLMSYNICKNIVTISLCSCKNAVVKLRMKL